jgi:type I restriction enzyme M protein
MPNTYHDIERLEADLWAAADNLRANSKLTSSDYFMPVLGVIFLRHAANRFEAATRQVEEDQATGRMPKRKVIPADYLRRRALWLPESARYDVIMQQAATSGSDRPASHRGHDRDRGRVRAAFGRVAQGLRHSRPVSKT